MRTLKIYVVALFVALAGAVYAVGSAREPAQTSHAAKASCCKARTQNAKQEASHSCDMEEGKGCCTDASDCCASHKSHGATATVAAAQGAKKEDAFCGCCKSHKASNGQLSSSRAKGAAAANTGCCGDDCCKDCGKAHKRQSEEALGTSVNEGSSCCASCGSCRKAQVARR